MSQIGATENKEDLDRTIMGEVTPSMTSDGLSDLKGRIIERLSQEESKSLNRFVLKRVLKIDDRDLPDFIEAIRTLQIEEMIRVVLGGPGGLVCLNENRRDPKGPALISEDVRSESELYPKVLESLRQMFVPEIGMNHHRYKIEVTAFSAKRNSLGKWSTPDISLVGVKTYKTLQAVGPVLVTFEIKKDLDVDITSVYQAKAHLRYGHFSYLLVRAPKTLTARQLDQVTYLRDACVREGVGFATFSDAGRWDSYDFRYHPFLQESINIPNSDLLDRFLSECFSEPSQVEIMRLIQGCARIERFP